MDNLSTDATAEILRDLSASIPIDYRVQTQDTYDQSAWVTQMARSAFEDHQADWVINNDADEFWMFPDLDARAYLAQLPQDVSGVVLRRHNAVLVRGESWNGFVSHPGFTHLFEAVSRNQLGQDLPGKCLHRASAAITVEQGNHMIRGHQGRIIRSDQARILHFPYRQFAHYRSKIHLGGAAYGRNTNLDRGIGKTWREQFDQIDTAAFTDFWDGLLRSRQQCIHGESNGALFQDDSLAATLTPLLRCWQQQRLRRAGDRLEQATNRCTQDYIASVLACVRDRDSPHPTSLPHNNLPFMVQGPQHHVQAIHQLLADSEEGDPDAHFTGLRDAFSLFPQNDAFLDWLEQLLRIRCGSAFYALRDHCAEQDVILHISCRKYVHRSLKSSQSFAAHGYRSVVVVGDGSKDSERFGFDFDGVILTLPVPDDYEYLGTKVFYAYLILALCCDVRYVVKVDDDLRLHDHERFAKLLRRMQRREQQYCGKVIKVSHREQTHGWHIGKCSNTRWHGRGYQYPMPRAYASGGFGYVLGAEALRACARMFLSMQAFFEMDCVQLEDVFVGLALEGAGHACRTCEYEDVEDPSNRYPDAAFAVLPGLSRLPDA